MPKKKGKKGKKGKGKGKKDGKQEPKNDKESDIDKSKANAALWEAKLEVIERSRTDYRDAARKLARANEDLTNQQYSAEKDTLDIISFLKRKDVEKEEKIAQLEEQLKEQKNKAAEESEQLVAEYKLRINELEETFSKRSGEFRMIQGELKMIKEFRKKKAHMEQELSDIKESMDHADRGHKESLSRMEHKFFREKLRLEKEAEQRIAQLAERAHNEAIVQLDEASRSVFKENIRLNEALSYHMKEVEELRRVTVTLAEENHSLMQHKETCDLMLKDSVSQLKEQRDKVVELKGKVAVLERALGRMAGEFEKETQDVQQRALVSTEAGQAEMDKLQKVLAMREREMNRVKRLARSVVEQRTELEVFFQEALAQVKQEIQASRQQHRQSYPPQRGTAWGGQQDHPRIRSFHKNQSSTTDLDATENWGHLHSAKVDISELTWEEKEKVLRLLFAKMNGLRTRKPTQPPALSESPERNQNGRDPGVAEEPFHMTFITQAPLYSMPPEPRGLPDIKTM
ncbi:basal body-orientation factor 1-like [Anguilla anguilla]|uniref:basal body-orientation factor 1-like n=1 Tax=Anguilla anguilla TaxID=7936 RepID=UPI0015B194E9|nr:basal body-orientation factor 1-like [Anguilla anguilla]